MSKLLALEEPDPSSDHVTFLVDQTRQRYVRLPSVNSADVVSCVHGFLCKYDVFGEKSKVVRKDRVGDYQPAGCADYSCVMTFYQLIIRSYGRVTRVEKAPFVTVEQLEDGRRALKSTVVLPPMPVDQTGSTLLTKQVEAEDASSSTDESSEDVGEQADPIDPTESSGEESQTVTAESLTESETETEPEPSPPPKRRAKTASRAKPTTKKTKTVQVQAKPKPKTAKKSTRR